MTFARWVFRVAGIYGILLIPPQYFLEDRIGRDDPPAITHPEYFYGFVGVTLAWQLAYLVIATDPPRYRPMMLLGTFGKVSFAAAAVALFARQRVSATVLGFALADFALGVLFVVAWRTTGRASSDVAEVDAGEHRLHDA